MKKTNLILFSTLLSLAGCAIQPEPTTPPPTATVLKFQKIASQMKSAGIQIIQQGDRLTLIIPTDQYFEPSTATVKEERKVNLQEMAVFVKNFAEKFPNSVVRVTGYTDQVFNYKTQQELSQNYAQAVSAYLFNAGINPHRIAVLGRASAEPIAAQREPSSAAFNRRVTIQIN